MQINISLSETQSLAISYSHTDFDFFVKSVVAGKIELAIEEIVSLVVKHCLDNNIQMPTTKDEIVNFAFNTGIVKTASERQLEVIDYGDVV